MQTYELTQKILAFGPTYEVRREGALDADPMVAAGAIDQRFFQE